MNTLIEQTLVEVKPLREPLGLVYYLKFGDDKYTQEIIPVVLKDYAERHGMTLEELHVMLEKFKC